MKLSNIEFEGSLLEDPYGGLNTTRIASPSVDSDIDHQSSNSSGNDLERTVGTLSANNEVLTHRVNSIVQWNTWIGKRIDKLESALQAVTKPGILAKLLGQKQDLVSKPPMSARSGAWPEYWEDRGLTSVDDYQD